jgi:O-antigen ligase
VSSSPTSERWLRAVAAILLTGAAITPVYIGYGGEDHFRVPKDLVLLATAIITIAAAAIGLVLGRIEVTPELRRRLKVPATLCAAGLGWTLISTATSTNRPLSIEALFWVVALGGMFLIGCAAFRVVPFSWVVIAVLAPALVNSVIVLVQATTLWNPWSFEPGIVGRATRNGLLGNPNYVGVYLAAPLLFAATQAIHGRGRRILFAIAAAVLGAAVLVTLTLTAIGSLMLAFGVLVVRWNRRRGLAVLVLVVAAAVAGGAAYKPMRVRLQFMVEAIQDGRWGRVVSGRLFPFYTAFQMFQDHPLTGVGPGCFKFQYMPYAIEAADHHPRVAALSGTQRVNFGETHNDHLQVLAEVGAPGYLLLIALVVSVASSSRGRMPEHDPRARLAHALALPLVILLLAVMLAQFALQLAASAIAFVVVCAACTAWRDEGLPLPPSDS